MNPILKNFPLGFPWKTQDPFLFCVHHYDQYPAGNELMGPIDSLRGRQLGNDFDPALPWRMYHGTQVPGFPAHPHRGFETVTVVTEGFVDHSDSLGAAGRFGNGDVQWMTAGKGVQHCEMFPLLNREAPNPLELFQIWLNLPAKSKMAPPYFSMLWNHQIPQVELPGPVRVKVIAGNIFPGAPVPPPDSWGADPLNEVAILLIEMAPNSTVELPASGTHVNRSVYFYEGSDISIQSKVYSHSGFEVNSQTPLSISTKGGARLLVLQGKPIAEPIAQYGPFVMNSQAEIQQAFREYQTTQFGGWPWETHDHVHDRDVSRFARYPDGRTERP